MLKKSLFLLAVYLDRRDAVTAFVQTGLLIPTSSAPAFSSKTLLGASVDFARAPLGHLVALDDDDNNNNNEGNSAYHLVSPADDVLELAEGQRLICVGDVHGDYDALERLLTIGGVYDKSKPSAEQWVGGNTILVQTGDVLDRGSEELQCFHLLTRLSQQAVAKGGHVILLWGNHEALNAGGMFHYTTGEAEYETLIGSKIDQQLGTQRWRIQYAGNQPSRWATYEPGNGVLAHPLLSNMKVAVKVGKTVCVHAGLTAKHLSEYGGIRGMNQQVQDWMIKVQCQNNNLGDYEDISAVANDVQRRARTAAHHMPEILGGADSPVWMRDYSSPNDAVPNSPKAQQMIDAALFDLQADRMVMGHTVQRKINSALGGKAWRVDVGASKGVMNGSPEVLEVVADKGGKEIVSVLTRTGKVAGEERQVGVEMSSLVGI